MCLISNELLGEGGGYGVVCYPLNMGDRVQQDAQERFVIDGQIHVKRKTAPEWMRS